jgi:squalene-associated FAD-dependent desaturase
MTAAPRVVVVGGGLAGISAAVDCADAGASVTLLESRPWLGGATYSFRRERLWIDNGQHVFLRCCSAYRALLDRLGVTGLTALQERMEIPVVGPGPVRSQLVRNGLPAPVHLASALARYRAIPVRDRARSAWAVRRLQRLDPTNAALDDIAFGPWLRQQGVSNRAIDAFWELVSLPTLNLRVDHASLALAAMVFRTALLTHRDAADIGYARVPLGVLHGEAAREALERAGADVRSRVRATAIEPGQREHVVRTGDSHVCADAVIVAVPHSAAAAVLPHDAGVDRHRLAALGRSPIVNIHVVYDRPVMDAPFVAGIATPVQWVFDRTEPSGLDDGQYLAVSLSAATDTLRMRTTDLRALFVPALEAMFPRAARARVRDFFVTRDPAATFRQAAGTARLRPGTRTRLPGLYLAGAWTDTGWPATMEGAVRSGNAAARAALGDLGDAAARYEEAAA